MTPKTPPQPPQIPAAPTTPTPPAPEPAERGQVAVVGIGASAGGLAAFEAFFSGVHPDTPLGIAFVIVQHLAPDHHSILDELIRRYTAMQVLEAVDGMRVQPDCVYIIPPHFDMDLRQGALHLSEPVQSRGARHTIDHFFRSMAKDLGARAIGIVLSGTGNDGTEGARAIKQAGGLVLVQSARTCEYDSMPKSVAAAGLADCQLAAVNMPAYLLVHVEGLPTLPDTTEAVDAPAGASSGDPLQPILILLRAHTGHDFSQYKPSTIRRRIERRMAVNRIDTLAAYLKFFENTPEEAGGLFADLLIGVTNFFRDPEAFEVLQEKVIPALFAGKPPGSTVRVWSTGCSTGEEAYTLAILLKEHMETVKQTYHVQVFATDIDVRAIAVARAGLYPADIAAHITPERLARFFVPEPGGQQLRISKGVRDLLVFSQQDLGRDPPFSKLDLISCRNLLIYMDAKLQSRLIPLFHYALVPGGTLFLGSSEGVGEFEALFEPLDRKAKLYRRKQDRLGVQRTLHSRYIAPVGLVDPSAAAARGSRPVAQTAKQPLRELMEQSLMRYAVPSSALVNALGDIVYLQGQTGMYLEPSVGEPGIQNILKMAREGLRPSLGLALREAVAKHASAFAANVSVKTNGHYTRVNVGVHPAAMPATANAGTALYLVVLERVGLSAAPMDASDDAAHVAQLQEAGPQDRIDALMLELRTKEAYLQSTTEELESSNEELKSSNEEMQSVNEELQSTNEELETSKEELQSVNEELATVNTELQTKVSDLSHANNDMNNLLAGTGVGTVFVDFELRILRFTPAASHIINLIPADVGRPVAHIVSNLVGYTSLVADVRAVLDTLVAREVEVQSDTGQWYTLRVQPYRTLDNVIEGAVISFVDISEMVRVREALARTQKLLEHTGELAQVGGWEVILQTMKLFWTLQMFRITGMSGPPEPSFEAFNQRFTPESRLLLLAAQQTAREKGTPYDLELSLQRADGALVWVRTQGFAEMHDGKAVRLYGTLQNVTERRAEQEALRVANAKLLARAKGRKPVQD